MGVVLATLFGLILFGERIPLIGWLGMTGIIACGITATFLCARAQSDSPVEKP
jgi:S-adenosylmethionine uptake transporter